MSFTAAELAATTSATGTATVSSRAVVALGQRLAAYEGFMGDAVRAILADLSEYGEDTFFHTEDGLFMVHGEEVEKAGALAAFLELKTICPALKREQLSTAWGLQRMIEGAASGQQAAIRVLNALGVVDGGRPVLCAEINFPNAVAHHTLVKVVFYRV